MKSLLIVLVGILIGVNCISQAIRPLEGTYQSTGNPALNPNLSIENDLIVEKLYQRIDETNSLSKYNNLNKNFIPIKIVGFSIAEIIPRIGFNEQVNLTEIRQIKLIDVRSDISKVGFFSVNLALKKRELKQLASKLKRVL